MAKLKINPDDTLAQVAVEKRLKVYTDFNPYLSKNNQVEVQTLSQVKFFHKKIKETRVLGEFVKDKNFSRWRRKRVMKGLIKFWDKDFHENMEVQKQDMLEKTKNIKRKQIKHVTLFFAYISGIISLLGILLLNSQTKYVQLLLKNHYINEFNQMIESSPYRQIAVGLVYLSLLTLFYIIFIKTYFDRLRKVGHNAENFINSEYKKLNQKFIKQHQEIKIHLLRSVRKLYKKKYKIQNIFDPQTLIKKLEKYSLYIEGKVTDFRKRYYWLLLIYYVLILLVLGITSYLGYQYSQII